MSRTVRARRYRQTACAGCPRCDPKCDPRLRPADRRRVQDDPRAEWLAMPFWELRYELDRHGFRDPARGCHCDDCDEWRWRFWHHIDAPPASVRTPPLTLPLAPLLRAA